MYNDRPLIVYILIGAGFCFGAIGGALFTLGVDAGEALGFSAVAAVLGSVWSWYWATRA